MILKASNPNIHMRYFTFIKLLIGIILFLVYSDSVFLTAEVS